MHLLIACAGSGRRMGAERNKLLLSVAGRPVLAWTLEAALASPAIRWIGVVGQPVDQADIEALVAAARPDRPVVWIQGGDTRQESVSNGLAALPEEAEAVLIHDGARCLVEPELIARCAEAVVAGKAVIAAAPVTDTIKQVDGEGRMVEPAPSPTLAVLPQIPGRLWCFRGDVDPLIPAEEVTAIEAALTAANGGIDCRSPQARHRLLIAPGAGHGYLCDMRADFQPEAAAAGWTAMLELFSEALGQAR